MRVQENKIRTEVETTRMLSNELRKNVFWLNADVLVRMKVTARLFNQPSVMVERQYVLLRFSALRN